MLLRDAFARLGRTDIRIEPLRGNVNTRLRKLDEGAYDAIVLAAALWIWLAQLVGPLLAALIMGSVCLILSAILLMVAILLWRPQGLYPVARR